MQSAQTPTSVTQDTSTEGSLNYHQGDRPTSRKRKNAEPASASCKHLRQQTLLETLTTSRTNVNHNIENNHEQEGSATQQGQQQNHPQQQNQHHQNENDSLSSSSETETEISHNADGRTKRTKRNKKKQRKQPKARGKSTFEKEKDFQQLFGDEMLDTKDDMCCRIAFGNIGHRGLPMGDLHVTAAIKKWLRDYEVNHLGAAEVKANWQNIPPHFRLQEIFRSENALRSTVGFNRHENNHTTSQPGGTMAMTMGQMTDNFHSDGADSTGLGRWVWQLFKGRNGVATRIYSCYLPIRTSQASLQSTYRQQQRFFSKANETTPPDPCAIFLRDLKQELEGRKMAGERLVVMLDANMDVRSGKIWELMNKLNLRDAILLKHSPFNAPATHQ